MDSNRVWQHSFMVIEYKIFSGQLSFLVKEHTLVVVNLFRSKSVREKCCQVN